MPKKQWLPAQQVDPNFYQLPSKKSKAIVIKRPAEHAIDTPESLIDSDEAILPQGKHANRIPYQAQPALNGATGQRHTTTTSITRKNAVETGKPDPPKSGVSVDGTSTARSATVSAAAKLDRISQPVNTVRTRSTLDIYAHKYVPYWLKAVNESASIPIIAPPLPRVKFEDYRSSFVASDFQEHLPVAELPPQYPCNVDCSELQGNNYQRYWQQRLQNEYFAQGLQNDAFGLFNIEIFLHDPNIKSYSIKVPGVRESTPRIDLGDILYIRPLSPVLPDTIALQAEQWSHLRDRVAPGFTGHEHHAVVWSILRKDETVIVRLGEGLTRGTKCNVIIPLSAHKYVPAWRAVNSTHSGLRFRHVRGSWLTSILFPDTHHGVLQTALPKGAFDLKWHDPALNFEQKRAVQAVVDAEYGHVPYLISGPPGTGKTKTVVETVSQLLKAPSRVTPHLLVCAPSDAAADTLLVRLSEHLRPQDLLRLNGWTRMPSEVPGEVRPFCYLDSSHLYTLPPFESLMSARVVVTSCRDANMLVAAGLTNHNLTRVALRMLRAIAAGTVDDGNLLHWTALLLDEAAQATEPEALIPLSVVAPFEAEPSITSVLPQVVMAGDEYQLGPRLASATVPDISETCGTSGLETSLFQRLFARPLYKDHPLSRSQGLRPLTKSMLPITRSPFANLIRNYRSHPAILSTSSALFYSDTLIPERPEVSPAILSWPLWPKQSSSVWPVMFHQNNGPDSVESVTEGDGTGSGSLMNHTEAQIALEMVQSLLRHVNGGSLAVHFPRATSDYLQPEDVIVMSPFRAQVNYLRGVFRDAGLYDVRIGPLEAFQGLESRVVVLCTTRTRFGQAPHPPAKYVNEDKARNLGVIDEPKRFNVAMTRAKEALIVIGHAEVLSCTRDICWISFLKFCLRNELCCGGPIGWIAKRDKAGRMKEGMGKLEMALRYADMQAVEGGEGDTVQAMQANGSGAREGQQSFKFKLRGTMIDLDEQMWQMQIGDEQEDEEEISHEDEEEDMQTREELDDEDGEDVEGAQGEDSP